MPRYNSLAEAVHTYADSGPYTITVTDEVTGNTDTTSWEQYWISAVAGLPGYWWPASIPPPFDIAELRARADGSLEPWVQALPTSPVSPWQQGTYVILGDGSHAYFYVTGDPDIRTWEVGDAPTTLGLRWGGDPNVVPLKDFPPGTARLGSSFQFYVYPDHPVIVDWGDGTP